MAHVKSLRPRHHEILRLAFMGMKNNDIAERVGISASAISCLLHSPLARAELARLNKQAEEKLVDVPLRTQLQMELNRAGKEAVQINRAIMNAPEADVKVRARIGMHFMDRVVFNKSADSNEDISYREILRSLNRIETNLGEHAVPIEGTAERIEGAA